MTRDDEHSVADSLRERLNSISEIVEEHITDDGLEARLRRLKDRAGDRNRGGPAGFHGRRALLKDLLASTRGSRRRPTVLTGPGGAGKTRVAEAVAEHVRAMGERVWWISAVDPVTMSRDLMVVAGQLGGAPHDLRAIARGSADAADRFWRLLDGVTPGWLVIFDEADDPRVLAAGNSPAGIQDLTGWVRSSAHGAALVTTRESDPRMWRAARLVAVGGLEETDAARILRELAPVAGDEEQARALARRLDGHPLSLHLAGSHLRVQAAPGGTFAAYAQMLDAAAEPHPRGHRAAASTGIPTARVLELSLYGLAQRGIPQAWPLLQLAGCYASATIPAGLLDADLLDGLLAAHGDTVPRSRRLDEALRGLREVGLIRGGSEGGIAVHPVIAAAGRAGLDGPEPYADRIRHTAVALLAADVDRLPYDRPESWPEFLRLGPHLLSLLETTAGRVDREHLVRLMETTARMARAFNRSGAGRTGSVVCERALTHGAVLGDAHPAVLRVQHQLAWAIADRGDLAEAEVLYRGVLRTRLREFGAEDPEVFDSRHELAWIAGCRQAWAEAEEGYRMVLRDSVRVLEPDDPRILTTRHELAWVIANQDRLGEAREAFRAVLADRARVLGSEHPQSLATRHELAWIVARQGEWAEAETDYRELLDLRLRILGEDDPGTMLTRHELAWIAARRGRAAEAEAGYEAVLDRRRRVLGEGHPQTRATREALDELRHGRIVDAWHLA
ncbi:tetratricopeptide repeat protein [Embleya sp. NPDC020630]|uniref:tetratricopeptide repeat protein n=1 Tax=Embleya sp. NPDC020630 TaxID=3363979 RepID=UPI00378F89A2